MEVGWYFDLRSHSGIYSLAKFETEASNGCTISTNIQINRLYSKDNRVYLDKIPFYKINPDVEVIGIAGIAGKEHLFSAIAVLNKQT